jgi:hypothetical protein
VHHACNTVNTTKPSPPLKANRLASISFPTTQVVIESQRSDREKQLALLHPLHPSHRVSFPVRHPLQISIQEGQRPEYIMHVAL